MKWEIGRLYRYTNQAGIVFILKYTGKDYNNISHLRCFTTSKSPHPYILKGFEGHLNEGQLRRLEYMTDSEAVLEML